MKMKLTSYSSSTSSSSSSSRRGGYPWMSWCVADANISSLAITVAGTPPAAGWQLPPIVTLAVWMPFRLKFSGCMFSWDGCTWRGVPDRVNNLGDWFILFPIFPSCRGEAGVTEIIWQFSRVVIWPLGLVQVTRPVLVPSGLVSVITWLLWMLCMNWAWLMLVAEKCAPSIPPLCCCCAGLSTRGRGDTEFWPIISWVGSAVSPDWLIIIGEQLLGFTIVAGLMSSGRDIVGGLLPANSWDVYGSVLIVL